LAWLILNKFPKPGNALPRPRRFLGDRVFEARFRRRPQFENGRLTAAERTELLEQRADIQEPVSGRATCNGEAHQVGQPRDVKILEVQIHHKRRKRGHDRVESFAGAKGIGGVKANADALAAPLLVPPRAWR